ncbi:MAG: methyltransferase [Gammaproteobacteria bacterium]|nr:methyltransferase [Gammaproteobacteria bacterium]
MKVCTDATLFGAMAPIEGGETVLDIGTGTGLLALMATQLGAVRATGVELTRESYEEARSNFHSSPWPGRLHAIHSSIQEFADSSSCHYDVIISNPPFFHRHSKATSRHRLLARHTDLLPYPELVDCVERLLAEHGLFYVMLPRHAVDDFYSIARRSGLHRIAQTDIRSRNHADAKISCLTFSRHRRPDRIRQLTIYQTERVYSAESKHYLSPFLLRFAKQD